LYSTRMSSQGSTPVTIPNGMKFLFGGSAGMGATVFVQPLDLVKTRMQITKVLPGGQKPTSMSVLMGVVKNEGFLTLYNGLSAGLLRQATYTTTRLGVYTYLFEKFSNPDGSPPSFLTKAGLGMTAGATGAFVGTPAEVALIRMTSDGNLPANQRRNYTMGRAMVVNAAQLASYSQAKQFLLIIGFLDEEKQFQNFFSDGILCHFMASMFSGFVTTVASMPVDIAKTRIQNMKSSFNMETGQAEYKGAVDVIAKVIKNEGFFSLWKGFTPYYFRLGPHTVLTFIFLEQLNKAYRSFAA